jgi:hypothetical protein
MSFDELVTALGQIEGLRDIGKRYPNFHFKSRPFLHFHGGPDGPCADVKFGTEFERLSIATSSERAELLARVQAHVSAKR